MNRRSFLKGISLSLITAMTISMTGCNFSSELTPEEALEEHSHLISVIDSLKMNYNNNIKTMDSIGLIFPDSEDNLIDTEYSLPWYIGSKINLSKNEYFIKKYTSEDLLFNNFGIKNKYKLFYFNKTYKGKSANERSIQLGFESINDLYKSILYKLTTYSATDIFIELKTLEKLGILNTEEILNSNKINEFNEKFVKNLFNNYIQFEKSLETKENNYSLNNYLKLWKYSVNDKKINFIKEDFELYSFAITLTELILTNTPKGVNINDG